MLLTAGCAVADAADAGAGVKGEASGVGGQMGMASWGRESRGAGA